MQITSRFTIAVHIITAIDYFQKTRRVSSEFLAGSVGVNPAIVRNVIGMMREAGILRTQKGSGGAELTRPLSDISLYDIYKAVDCVDSEAGLFHFHEQPNPECPVGRNIHQALDESLAEIQRVMEEKMRSVSLADISERTRQAIGKEAETE